MESNEVEDFKKQPAPSVFGILTRHHLSVRRYLKFCFQGSVK